MNGVNVGDVIQLPLDHKWPGTLWIVDEIKAWGVTAYHQPLSIDGERAYIRLVPGQFVVIGAAPWVLNSDSEPQP